MTINPNAVRATVVAAVALGATTITAFNVEFTRAFEGTVLEAYLDPVNIPTICSGHTKGVRMDMRATKEECFTMAKEDLAVARAEAMRCLPSDLTLHPNQWAIVFDFVFHYGPGGKGVKDGFCVLKSGKSSGLRNAILKQDCRLAANQFQYWSNAGGKQLRGLVRRNNARQTEWLKWCVN
ncbi:MAG TPA: glycoside hydrolase family protein [Rhodocyclaceae bacterium]|nr:glycoside hydrolase family protein [Rhodocyclaceae bacterium]